MKISGCLQPRMLTFDAILSRPVLSLLGLLMLSACLGSAQDAKQTSTPPPPKKSSPAAEECAPTDSSVKASTAENASKLKDAAGSSSATEEEETPEPVAFKLKSSLDDRQDISAIDCSKEPEASSAACQRKQSKAAANQCERTEGASDLTLQKQ